jgi:hypothetical protein
MRLTDPLNARQLDVLRWIADGCPEEVMVGTSHKRTATALHDRRLVKVSKRGGTWSATVTDIGRHYLAHGNFPPKIVPTTPSKTARTTSSAAEQREPIETTPGTRQQGPPAPSAIMRRLPGTARPHEEALRVYQEANDRLRDNINPVLWRFWAPDPDEFYRWRVQLDCGCVNEVLTRGEEVTPIQRQFREYAYGPALPIGQMYCHHDDSAPQPYRDIVEWRNHAEKIFPADPIEPQHRLDAEIWAAIRHDEPRTCAVWTVTLSCGHVTESVVTDLHWKPVDGPIRVSGERQQELSVEFEEWNESNPDGQSAREREHMKRMIANGWPPMAPTGTGGSVPTLPPGACRAGPNSSGPSCVNWAWNPASPSLGGSASPSTTARSTTSRTW